MKISSFAPLGALFVLLALGACTPPVATGPGDGTTPGGSTTPGGTTPAAVTIDQSLWGPWVRMDRVENWYLAADKLTSPMGSNAYTSATLTKLVTTGATLEVTADSADMIMVTQGTDTFYLYRQADRSATFNGTVEQQVVTKSLARSAEPRSFMSALQLAVQAKDNPSDLQTVFTAIDGSYTIANAIAGAIYKITPKIVDAVTNALADGPTIEVVAGDDGQDVGTVTIPDPTVKYNFKVSAAPSGNPYLFADGTAQNVTLTFKNVGSARSLAPTYTLVSLNPKATLGGTLMNNLLTFEAGTTQTLTVPVTVTAITAAFVDVTIGVTLDTYNGQSWHDRTTVRFYKDDKLKVNLTTNNWVNHATVLTPDRKALSIPGTQIVVPRADTGYSVAMSGATAASETKYALWVGEANAFSPDLSAFINPGAYEPNGSPRTATGLYMNDTAPLLGYLAVDDMDFFAIGAAAVTAPAGLPILAVNGSTASLNWNAAPGAEKYFVYRNGVAVDAAGTTATSRTGISYAPGDQFAVKAFVAGKGYSAGGTALETVPVAGGTFFNGTANVTLSAFSMSAYEVTQALYKSVTGSSPSGFNGTANKPVESVTWYDAVEFCNKLSDLAGLQPAYTITGHTPSTGYPITSATVTMDMAKTGYRLPTEAEWMWAAMGGASDAKVGDNVSTVNTGGYNKAFAGDNGSNAIASYAWTYENSPSGTQPVGTKLPNELGIYDLSGNVWEWNWDWYGSYDASPTSDPTGAASGSYRVLRGGRWSSYAANATVSGRGYSYPGNRGNDLGFRVVRP